MSIYDGQYRNRAILFSQLLNFSFEETTVNATNSTGYCEKMENWFRETELYSVVTAFYYYRDFIMLSYICKKLEAIWG